MREMERRIFDKRGYIDPQSQEYFDAQAAEIEAAKRDDASAADKLWLQSKQEMSVYFGLHPDAICASPNGDLLRRWIERGAHAVL